MNRRSMFAVIVLASMLGVGVAALLGGLRGMELLLFAERDGWEDVDDDQARVLEPSNSSSSSITARDVSDRASPTPTLIPVAVGSQLGVDLDDVLLLYDSTRVRDFDINFCRIAEYYGLQCRRIDLRTTDLQDGIFRDPNGEYFKLIGTAAENLLGDARLATRRELEILVSSVRVGGVNLLISNVTDQINSDVLVEVTRGGVVDVIRPHDQVRDWTASVDEPLITREFTGRTILAGRSEPQDDFALVLGDQSQVKTLLSSTDDEGDAYPIFVRVEQGAGSVFVDGGGEKGNVDELSLREMYYDTFYFSSIAPAMLAMRYALGDETWHSAQDFANLTIDDPALAELSGHLIYSALLQEMKAHGFHTTIAVPSVLLFESEPEILAIFLTNPDRFSLALHGNNHDGYEFYRYSLPADEANNTAQLRARPLAEQEADILQGLARMERYKILSRIPFDRVMIFPWAISPEPTLQLLKKYNFLATVNGQDVPLDTDRPTRWDFGMYQAIMDFASFPLVTRRHPGTYEPFRPDLQPFILDLFIDKPALIYSHEAQLFPSGIDAFSPLADEINDLWGDLEWQSLGHILAHLHLEKVEDDGSVAIMMYGNQLVLTNEFSEEQVYHIAKEETLNVPILSVTVNGHEFSYRTEENQLELDMRLPPGGSGVIAIRYGNQG